ncbi:MAG: starvation-sensing protein RspA [Armatimonadetes bacterium]|nr:starvation-sensing protein RspA [Armatimonadota bacterium]
MPVTIQNVRTFLTAPYGPRLVVVRVETNEPGLYGLGCATFTQRALAVVTALDEYLNPFLRGREVDDIEDIWQCAFVSSYWRNGPILNNAMSGVDQALWDIKGKRAGMPVYQLLGGKCRECVPLYHHCSGQNPQEVEDDIRASMEKGYRYCRAQVATPGYSTYGARAQAGQSAVWEPAPYVRSVVKLFDHLRATLGEEIELLHDIHERIPPIHAINLAKQLEKHSLFFLEDPFAPEDVEYHRLLRQQTSTPIAMGELFSNVNEYLPLIRDQLIDFIRVHVSTIGGISPARKLAALCEYFGVRTAWHGPGDVSPIGHAANMHLDLACYNFGIQEETYFREAAHEVFPGCPEIRDGCMWPNDRPGLGIDLDEAAAARYPIQPHETNGCWPPIRRADGTVIRP